MDTESREKQKEAGKEQRQSLIEAAKEGDISVFAIVSNNWSNRNDYHITTLPDQNNIIHLAVLNGRLRFLEEALKWFPELYKGNSNGDTPLHTAVHAGRTDVVSFLINHFHVNNDDSWLLSKDSEGNTPFHVALMRPHVGVAATFCRECKQDQLKHLFTVRNVHNQTPLHLLAQHHPANEFAEDWEEIVKIYGDILLSFDKARAAQDDDGNTPVHLAIKHGKFLSAKFLIQRCLESAKRQELSINNNAGDSVFDLLASQKYMTDMIKEIKEMLTRGRRLVNEQALANIPIRMSDELYRAAVNMDSRVFEGPQDTNFLSQTPGGSNIIHLAIQHGRDKEANVYVTEQSKEKVMFIEKALQHFPTLLLQEDSNGDTPLHLAAKWYGETSRTLLKNFGNYYDRMITEHKNGVLARPWRAKNSAGNMPIHEALRFNNSYAALALMGMDRHGASVLNALGETPLHVYARFGFNTVRSIALVATESANGHESSVERSEPKSLSKLLLLIPRFMSLLVGISRTCKKRLTAKLKPATYGVPIEVKHQQSSSAASKGRIPAGGGRIPARPLADLANGERDFSVAKNLYKFLLPEEEEEDDPAADPSAMLHQKDQHIEREANEDDDNCSVFDTFIKRNEAAVYVRDVDGLTPLLRAAKCGHFQTVLRILKSCPQSASIRDLRGRTFLHLIHLIGEDVGEDSAESIFKKRGEELFEISEADAQRLTVDSEGNTPLHYAIKNGNVIMAAVLMRRCLQTADQSELTIANNEGETVTDLIESHEVPNEIVNLIRRKHWDLTYSARNIHGVRKEEIKDSASALSVIAALLATVTFAAVFQVPGGYNQDSGHPIFSKRAAFQVFLVADTLAMCISTVVLFSLLWIMSSSKTQESFVLLDISVLLLQVSFYTTLVAFMTGVYVVISSKALWLAILSCALCTITILVSWRRSVLFITKWVRRIIDAILKARGRSFKSIC